MNHRTHTSMKYRRTATWPSASPGQKRPEHGQTALLRSIWTMTPSWPSSGSWRHAIPSSTSVTSMPRRTCTASVKASTRRTPRLPVHPHCLCHLAPVYRSELKGKKAVDQLEEGGRAWLENQSLYHRQQILGIQGTKAFANRDSWTKWARNYTGARLAGRPKDLPESLKPYLHDGKIKIEEVSKCLPDESLSEFDKRIHDYLESPYCTKVFTDRQKIHIKGTDLYNPDKSYYMNAESLNNIDIKELLLSGKIKLTKAGDWNKKVLVHHPGIKGVVVHQYGSDTVLTEYSLVHVSDKGVHMVPKEAES